MENRIFRSVTAELSEFFGPAKPHVARTGARFTSAQKGKLTVYHSNIATGNSAEIAFEPASMARRLMLSEAGLRSFVAQLRGLTNQPTETNARYNWSRVGLASQAHADMVVAQIQERLGGVRS